MNKAKKSHDSQHRNAATPLTDFLLLRTVPTITIPCAATLFNYVRRKEVDGGLLRLGLAIDQLWHSYRVYPGFLQFLEGNIHLASIIGDFSSRLDAMLPGNGVIV